jgi:hypothetical protein
LNLTLAAVVSILKSALPAESKIWSLCISATNQDTRKAGLTASFSTGRRGWFTFATILGTSITTLQASTSLIATELFNRTVTEFLTGWLRAAFLGLLAAGLLRNACIRLNLRLRTGTT